MKSSLFYQIALKNLAGIGASRAKKLLAYCGGVEQVFQASKKELSAVPGIGRSIVEKLNKAEAFTKAEREMKFIEKHQIKPLFFLEKDYPKRLVHCDDGPLLLYTKGNFNANTEKVVGIIGTRNVTDYGRRITERLVEELKKHDALVVSGLAYGVDILAHRASVQLGVQTIGVLGHGLDRIYPQANKPVAEKMLEHGGLFSEFESETKFEPSNFPMRNRIVAGMVDAILVVESGVKGGSLITAKLAADYNRDVFAYPGPIDAKYSEGCNHLIKTQQANLIEGIKDLEYLLGWELDKTKKPVQKKLFVDLKPDEKTIYDLLQIGQKISIDTISLQSEMPMSKVSMLLLELEFKGLVQSLPGKMFTAC